MQECIVQEFDKIREKVVWTRGSLLQVISRSEEENKRSSHDSSRRYLSCGNERIFPARLMKICSALQVAYTKCTLVVKAPTRLEMLLHFFTMLKVEGCLHYINQQIASAGTYFLWGEAYIGKEGLGIDPVFSPMPESHGAFLLRTFRLHCEKAYWRFKTFLLRIWPR